MAQTLEEFERIVEPLIPSDKAQAFKALVRRKMGALAKDAIDIMELEGTPQAMNAHAQDLKDRLHPDGAASARSGGGH